MFHSITKIEIAKCAFFFNFTCLLAIRESVNEVSILRVIPLLLVKRRILSLPCMITILKCNSVLGSGFFFFLS